MQIFKLFFPVIDSRTYYVIQKIKVNK